LGVADAFVLNPRFSTRIFDKSLLAKQDDSDHEDCLSRNKARTDLRNFLTQRSIQSFAFLLRQVRDEQTVQWIESTLEFEKIDSFHGTGAFNATNFPSWDSVFMDFVTLPKEVVVVEIKRPQRRRGLASTNNYLESLGKKDTKKEDEVSKNPYLEETAIEYEFEINPASLVARIISVREQISKEWVKDLETLVRSNDHILESYLDQQREARLSQEEEVEEEEEEEEDKEEEEEDKEEVEEEEDDGVEEASIEEASVEEASVEKASVEKASVEDTKYEPPIVYDRSAMTLLTNSFGSQDRGSTPFRRANFDLLLLLSTQESIHRVLREYSEEEERMGSYEWLRDFYSDRVEHFDGHQSYGRADDFLEELLLSPPVFQKTGKDGIRLIDPMGMAEDIIRERSEVAWEWQKLVSKIPEEHTDLRRLLLDRRMLDSAKAALEESVKVIDELEEIGAFE